MQAREQIAVFASLTPPKKFTRISISRVSRLANTSYSLCPAPLLNRHAGKG
jgi:hypothetical protein